MSGSLSPSASTDGQKATGNVDLLRSVLEKHFASTFDAFAFLDVDDSNVLGALQAYVCVCVCSNVLGSLQLYVCVYVCVHICILECILTSEHFASMTDAFDLGLCMTVVY